MHTTDGDVLDYFSRHIDSHGNWQQVAVAYDGEKGTAEFYINGFPLEAEKAPQVGIAIAWCLFAQLVAASH